MDINISGETFGNGILNISIQPYSEFKSHKIIEFKKQKTEFDYMLELAADHCNVTLNELHTGHMEKFFKENDISMDDVMQKVFKNANN